MEPKLRAVAVAARARTPTGLRSAEARPVRATRKDPKRRDGLSAGRSLTFSLLVREAPAKRADRLSSPVAPAPRPRPPSAYTVDERGAPRLGVASRDLLASRGPK